MVRRVPVTWGFPEQISGLVVIMGEFMACLGWPRTINFSQRTARLLEALSSFPDMNRFFAEGEEFALIERMFRPDHFSPNAKGLGDDAFLFEPKAGSKWVITTDSSVEGVHYRLDWTSPARALRKALLASLSDINAMGGVSRHAFFNLGARPDWGKAEFETFGHILRELEEAHGFRISGGNTVRTSGPGFFAFTVMGEIEGTPLLRSACVPGHRIYMSGTLGCSSAGLSLLKEGKTEETANGFDSELIRAHFDPAPPIKLGPYLASLGKPIGAIDISDGLSSELWHLSRQSGCSLRIQWDKLPKHPSLGVLTWDEIRRFVLFGGEEYQLLFTGVFSNEELRQMSVFTPISEIGAVEEGNGVFLEEGGGYQALTSGGYSH